MIARLSSLLAVSASFWFSNLILIPCGKLVAAENNGNWTIPALNVNRTAIEKYLQSILDCKPEEIGAFSLSIVQLDDNDNVNQSMAAGFGRTSLTEKNQPNATSGTRFCMGSITKHVTAQMVGKVLEANNKTFDITLKEILPDNYQFYANSDPGLAKHLTLRDLLSHRSAIPRHDNPWAFGMTKDIEEAWKNLFHLNAISKDIASVWRSSFNYNNWMVTLAAYAATILHDPTGKTKWEDLIREFFFKPLQLNSAVFFSDNHQWKNFAVPAEHYVDESKWTPMNTDFMQQAMRYNAPAGGICMNAEDMIKYLLHLTRKSESSTGAPSRKTVHDTFMPSSYIPTSFTPLDPAYTSTQEIYGMGWWVGSYKNARVLAHSGNVFGFLSNLIVLPDYNAAVYLSSTNDPWYSYHFEIGTSLGIVDILMGTSVSPQQSTEFACKTHLPAISRNSTGALNCTVAFDSFVQSLGGLYSHPTFGDININHNLATNQLRFYFGTQGSMSLCNQSQVSSNNRIYTVKIDSNSTMQLLNADIFFNKDAFTVGFDTSVTPGKIALKATFFEPSSDPPLFFYKNLTSKASKATKLRLFLILFAIGMILTLPISV